QARINELLKTKNDIVSSRNLKKEIAGHIVFDQVGFVYPDSGTIALSNVSFEVKPGESVAIIGTTGSGKTTIGNLILRMYDASTGYISIDGRDIKEYDLSNLRGQIGYVPQDVFLFSDTIWNNIAFGSTGLTKEQIIQAAKDADV